MINRTRTRLRSELAAARRDIVRLQERHVADTAEISRLNTLVENLADENIELEDARDKAAAARNAERVLNANLRTQLDALTKDPTARALAERLAELTAANHAQDVPVGSVDIFQADGAA